MRRTARMTDHGTDAGPVSSWAVRRAMCCGSTPNVVRVFICASKEYRMKKVAEVRGQPGGDTQEHRPVRRRTGRLLQNRLRAALGGPPRL